MTTLLEVLMSEHVVSRICVGGALPGIAGRNSLAQVRDKGPPSQQAIMRQDLCELAYRMTSYPVIWM